MKTVVLLLFLSLAGYGQQYFDLFSGSNRDTLFATTTDSAKVVSEKVYFLEPFMGKVSIYGKRRVLAGTDTTITVYLRMIGNQYDSPQTLSPDDSIGVIADGDSAFFFPVSEMDYPHWGECDGIQVVFQMDTVGTRTIKMND